jgi:hypothetical protein
MISFFFAKTIQTYSTSTVKPAHVTRDINILISLDNIMDSYERKCKEWWSTIPTISTKRTITSQLYSLSTKKNLWHMTFQWFFVWTILFNLWPWFLKNCTIFSFDDQIILKVFRIFIFLQFVICLFSLNWLCWELLECLWIYSIS